MIMRINSDNLCLMLEDNETSIPPWPPTTKNDLSIRRSLYRCSSRHVELLPRIQSSCIRDLIRSCQGSYIDSISSSNTPQGLPLLYFMIHSRMFYPVSRYTLCGPHATCGKRAM